MIGLVTVLAMDGSTTTLFYVQEFAALDELGTLHAMAPRWNFFAYGQGMNSHTAWRFHPRDPSAPELLCHWVPPADCILCAMDQDVENGDCRASRAAAVGFIIGRRGEGLAVCEAHSETVVEASKATEVVLGENRVNRATGGAS